MPFAYLPNNNGSHALISKDPTGKIHLKTMMTWVSMDASNQPLLTTKFILFSYKVALREYSQSRGVKQEDA